MVLLVEVSRESRAEMGQGSITELGQGLRAETSNLYEI